jgi:lycopene beta-cyclase
MGARCGSRSAIHVLIALTYTTPWDNYLVATGVWYYNPDLVTGIVIGYVPIEEYTFFVVETILAGLWWWFLARRSPLPRERIQTQQKTRLRLSGRRTCFTLDLSSPICSSSATQWTYLSIILFWALPAILPNCCSARISSGITANWSFGRSCPGAYLSLMDIVALTDTTWSISRNRQQGFSSLASCRSKRWSSSSSQMC